MADNDNNSTNAEDYVRPVDALIVSDVCWIPAHALSATFSRSSGPGGQAVNKINSRVQLRVLISSIIGLSSRAAERLRRLAGQRCTAEDELLLQCDTHRSQLGNRKQCEARLIDLIAQALIEPKRRRPTRPSKAMIQRRLNQKKQQAEKKRRRRRDRSPDDF